MSKVKSSFKRLTERTSKTIKKVAESDSRVVTKARTLTTDAQRRYEESGAKDKVEVVQSQISGKLDEISGQAMYQLVQERLAEQELFNDLIATKLHEALERISELEKLLSQE